MKVLKIVPYGFECLLGDCPAGPFLFKSGTDIGVGFKSEYSTEGKPYAYNEAGEFYCGDSLVQPAIYEWSEE